MPSISNNNITQEEFEDMVAEMMAAYQEELLREEYEAEAGGRSVVPGEDNNEEQATPALTPLDFN